MNVILGIAVPAGALQPRGDDQPGGLEPAGLTAVDPDAVVAGSGDPGPCLQVVKSGPVGPVQDLLERLFAPGPVRGCTLVSGLAGAALVFPDRGVQDGDGLGEGDGDVVVGGGLAGGLGGLAFEFDEPFGGGVRLGGGEPGQVVGEARVAAAGSAEPGAGARIGLPVHPRRTVGVRRSGRG